MKRQVKAKTKDASQLTHDTVPASVGLVKEVRDELRADIRSVDHKVHSLEHKIEALDHKVEAMRSEFSAQFEQVNVGNHRTQVLMEEQRSENRIVLDGLKTVLARQDRIEAEGVDLRNTVKSLQSAPRN